MTEATLSFAFVAQIQVLLVPIQPIKRATYAKHCALVRSIARIPIRDIPTDPRGPSASLSAQPTSNGAILLHYVDSYSRSQAYLHEFQTSRRVLGIIGVLDCAEWDDLTEAQAEFTRLLSKHPKVLASRCYAFDPSDSQRDDVVDGNVVVIPNVGDLNFYMSTLLADFSASLLHELSNMVALYSS